MELSQIPRRYKNVLDLVHCKWSGKPKLQFYNTDLNVLLLETDRKLNVKTSFDAQLIVFLTQVLYDPNNCLQAIIFLTDSTNVDYVVKVIIDEQFINTSNNDILTFINVVDYYETLENQLNLQFRLKHGLRKRIHDIKTPLNSLMLHMEFMEMNNSDMKMQQNQLNLLRDKFDDYCNWMPKQLYNYVEDECNHSFLLWKCSLKNYVYYIEKIGEDIGIVVKYKTILNNTDYVIQTVKGFEWWLSKLAFTLRSLFLIDEIYIDSSLKENLLVKKDDEIQVCVTFTAFITEHWRERCLKNFQNKTKLLIQLQVIHTKIRTFNYDLALQHPKKNILKLELKLPPFNLKTT